MNVIRGCGCAVALLFFAVLLPVRAQTLAQALDATNLTWTTSSSNAATGWFSQTATTHDGISAAEAGSHPSSSGFTEFSFLQTTVTGPGTLTFWWYGSASDIDGSQLSFQVGGVTQATVASGSPWTQQTIYLGSGSQALKWTYSLLPYAPNFYPGFVDQVSWTTGATAPVITGQPFSQSIVPGLNATFMVSAGGTPPLKYQWQFNGTNISTATNSTLTVTNAQGTNLGNYHVIVANAVGTNRSAEASLEFGEVAVWGYDPILDNRGAAPTGATNVLQISAGLQHNLLLTTNHSVLVWGATNVVQATQAGNPSSSLAVAALVGNSVVLNPDGTVGAWGISGITNVPATLGGVVALAPGPIAPYALALKGDGTVVVWNNSTLSGTNIPSTATNVVAVAAGQLHCLALTAAGRILTWGDNTYGQRNVPGQQLYSATNKVVAIAAGGYHSMALRSDGTVFAWGSNAGGQTNVPSTARGVVAIAAGYNHCLALRTNGTIVAWGLNDYGQVSVPANLTNVIAISAGSIDSMALVGRWPRAAVRAAKASPAASVFNLSLPTQSGRIVELDYKNSLADTNWTTLPFVAGNGTNVLLTDPAATNAQRFYQVRQW